MKIQTLLKDYWGPLLAVILLAASGFTYAWSHVTDADRIHVAQTTLNLKVSYDMELMRAKAEIVRLRAIKEIKGLTEDQEDDLERQKNNKKHYQGLLRDMKS